MAKKKNPDEPLTTEDITEDPGEQVSAEDRLAKLTEDQEASQAAYHDDGPAIPS